MTVMNLNGNYLPQLNTLKASLPAAGGMGKHVKNKKDFYGFKWMPVVSKVRMHVWMVRTFTL
jgi:hypothetical protein